MGAYLRNHKRMLLENPGGHLFRFMSEIQRPSVNIIAQQNKKYISVSFVVMCTLGRKVLITPRDYGQPLQNI